MIKRIKQWFYNKTKIYIVIDNTYDIKHDRVIKSKVDSVWRNESNAKKRTEHLALSYETHMVYYLHLHLNKPIYYLNMSPIDMTVMYGKAVYLNSIKTPSDVIKAFHDIRDKAIELGYPITIRDAKHKYNIDMYLNEETNELCLAKNNTL